MTPVLEEVEEVERGALWPDFDSCVLGTRQLGHIVRVRVVLYIDKRMEENIPIC